MTQQTDYKSWKKFLADLLTDFDSAAVVTHDGDTLEIKYENLADIGTLGAAAQTAIKYFPLNIGDIVLLNDPYGGGTTLSMMTLVAPILKNQKNGTDLYIVTRFGFRPRLVITENLNEEGLRIPPTPIMVAGQLQQPILDAISSHPDCPAGFLDKINSHIKAIQNRVYAYKQISERRPQTFSHTSMKNYLKESRNILERYLGEYAAGDYRIEIKIDVQTTLRLHLQFTHDHIEFDFSGTTPSKQIGLTDAAAFGACVGAVMAFLQKPLPLNSGAFSFFHVTTPLGCFLNAKYPTPTFRGMNEGAQIVATATLDGLLKTLTPKKMASHSLTPAYISLQFSNQQKFFDALPGGTGATSENEGSDALFFWVRNRLQNSVQEIEARFPLQILQAGTRMNSGGKGTFRGGHGLTKEYLLTEDAELSWSLPGKNHSASGFDGGFAGAVSEIIIFSPQGKQEAVSQTVGKMKLTKNSRFIVSSGGGGGFGKMS